MQHEVPTQLEPPHRSFAAPSFGWSANVSFLILASDEKQEVEHAPILDLSRAAEVTLVRMLQVAAFPVAIMMAENRRRGGMRTSFCCRPELRCSAQDAVAD